MVRVRLNSLFASILLAACAANHRDPEGAVAVLSPNAPDAGQDSSVTEPLDAAVPGDASDAGATMHVVMHHAPPVTKSDPVSPRPPRALTGSEITAMLAKAKPLPTRLPDRISYIASISGVPGHRYVYQSVGAPPSSEELTAAMAETKEESLIWKKNGEWFAGEVGEAIFPVDSLEKLSLLVTLQIAESIGGARPDTWRAVTKPHGFDVIVTQDVQYCPHSSTVQVSVAMSVGRYGSVEMIGSTGQSRTPCVGRDTEGSLRATRGSLGNDRGPGEYFARLAADEATSVDSFTRLSLELRTAGAPAEFVARSLRAARDEVRHAQEMACLADRYGVSVDPHASQTFELRPLTKVLLENAREGCVNESYAALVALHQAAIATDGDVRAAMESVARDECRHAELAWDLHRWGLTQVSGEARLEIQQELERAFDDLSAHLNARVCEDWMERVGEPTTQVATRLASELRNAAKMI